MRKQIAIVAGALAVAGAACWSARNHVAGTEPIVVPSASRQTVPLREAPGNTPVLVKVKIIEADSEAVDAAWKKWAQNRADSARQAGEPLEARVIDATAIAGTGIYSEKDANTILAEVGKHAGTKVRAEPSLTVLSGRTASLQSGGAFGARTIVGVGYSSNVVPIFRNVGLSAIVKPTALADGGVLLKVTCESSEVDETTTVSGVPGLKSQRVNPSLMRLNAGQSVVMFFPKSDVRAADLTKEPTRDSKDAQSANDRRMFVVVTPEVLKPLVADDIPLALPASFLPTQNYYAPFPPILAQPVPGFLQPVEPPGPWPSAFPAPSVMTRLQHLQAAQSHLKQAGLTESANAVQKEIKLEQRAAAQRELQQRERELEQLQKELESLRRSLSEDTDSSSQ